MSLQAAFRLLRPTATRSFAVISGTSFVRSKHTLPDMPYDYGALEPAISGKIMEVYSIAPSPPHPTITEDSPADELLYFSSSITPSTTKPTSMV